jgi:predicted nucleic acid-binding protein
MNLVVDSNIVISGLITPNGTISKLIINNLAHSRLICPQFLFDELISKFDKIKKITNLTDEQLKEIVFRFVKRIDFIENELIDVRFQKEAYELVKDIDKKDLLFIALSLKTGFKLWTGDKKLMSGLAIKGFNNIISTQQLLEQFENSWE